MANLIDGRTLHTTGGQRCGFETQACHGAEERGHTTVFCQQFAQGIALLRIAVAFEYAFAKSL